MTTTTAAAFRNPHSRLQAPFLWLLTFTMMLGPITFFQQVNLENWRTMPWMVGVVIGWGLFSTYYFHDLSFGNHAYLFTYRSLEAIILLALFRVYTWFVHTTHLPTMAEWQQILREPSVLFNGLWTWVGFSLVLLFAWYWIIALASLLLRIDLSSYEVRFYSLSRPERKQAHLNAPLLEPRTPLLQAFFRYWIYGGMILIAATALSTISMDGISEAQRMADLTRLPLPTVLLVALLLYFFAGFWLLGYVRYTVLFSYWLRNGIRPRPKLAQIWRRRSWLTLLGIGGVAAFLPIGSTLPIVYFLQAVFGFVGLVGQWIVDWFDQLFGGRVAEPYVPPASLPVLPNFVEETTQAIPPSLTGGVATLTLANMLAIILFLLVVVALYLSYSLVGTTDSGIWARLRAWWQSLWADVSLSIGALRQKLVQPRKPKVAKNIKPAATRVRVDRLSAREQIRYFYLAVVQRAAKKGVVREDDQTPSEFLQRLEEEWPDSAEDSQQLTSAFLHARYSRQDVADEAGVVKQIWKRVRSSLRKRNRSTQGKV